MANDVWVGICGRANESIVAMCGGPPNHRWWVLHVHEVGAEALIVDAISDNTCYGTVSQNCRGERKNAGKGGNCGERHVERSKCEIRAAESDLYGRDRFEVCKEDIGRLQSMKRICEV